MPAEHLSLGSALIARAAQVGNVRDFATYALAGSPALFFGRRLAAADLVLAPAFFFGPTFLAPALLASAFFAPVFFGATSASVRSPAVRHSS